MSSIGSDVYSGLATYGRIRSIITLVITGVICIGLLIVGIVSVSKKPTRTSSTDGKITIINPKSYTYTYNVDNKNYTGVENTNSTNNSLGQGVKVYYNPNSPSESRIGMSNKNIGIILIIASFVIFGIAALITYFTIKSKTFAAIEGGAAVYSTLEK